MRKEQLMKCIPKFFNVALSGLVSIGILTGIAACGGGGGNGSGTGTGTGTVTGSSFSGPGSKWDFSLNDDNSFQIEHRPDAVSAIDMTVDGSYARLASGFLKLTVGSATGTNAPTAGDAAWALEVPGYALMVKPIDPTSDQIIAMVKSGSCPAADVDANWVIVKQDNGADASDNTRDYFGTFHFDSSTGTPSLPARYSIADPLTDLGGNALTNGACANGLMQVSGAVMYLTDNGGAIVHTGTDDADETDDQFIFALAQSAISNVNNLDGNYAGMLFDDSSIGTKIQPVALACTAGNCVGNIVDDIDTGALSVDTVTVALSGTVDQPGNGFITGTITDPGSSTGNMTCMVETNAAGTAKNIISCVGQSPGDTTKMFNVLLVSL
jgi:hypothetical protein